MKLHRIMILVLMFLLLSGLSLADTFNPSITINNVIPAVTTVLISPSPIFSNLDVILWCNTTVIDNNGYLDINAVNATFWHSTSSENASDSIYDHYTNTSCSFGISISETSMPVSCSFFIDGARSGSGEWSCKVTATDTSKGVGYATSTVVKYCGDGICSAGESCSTCSVDCGACSSSGGGGSSGSGGSGGGGVGGGGIVTTASMTSIYSKILPYNKISITDRQGSLIGLDFVSNKELTNVKITIEMKSDKPYEVTLPQGYVYQFIKIYHSNIKNEDLENVELTFRVERAWLSQYNLDENSFILQRYSDGWQKLETVKLNEDEVYLYFKASSPGLSVFAITAQPRSAILPFQPMPLFGDEINELSEQIDDSFSISSNVISSLGKRPNLSYSVTVILMILILIFLTYHYKLRKKSVRKPMRSTKSSLRTYSEEQLRGYIKSAFAQGCTHTYIKALLLTHGWRGKQIDDAIRSVEETH